MFFSCSFPPSPTNSQSISRIPFCRTSLDFKVDDRRVPSVIMTAQVACLPFSTKHYDYFLIISSTATYLLISAGGNHNIVSVASVRYRKNKESHFDGKFFLISSLLSSENLYFDCKKWRNALINIGESYFYTALM